MERNVFLVIVSYAVFFFLHVQANLDCSKIVEVQEKCFSNEGFEMNYRKIGFADTIVPSNLTATCRNKEKYKKAIICHFELGIQCLEKDSMNTNLLPDNSSLVQSTDYMCQHVKALDDSCLLMADSAMKECAELKNKSKRYYDADVENTLCSPLHIAYECVQEGLRGCSDETILVVLDIINKYSRPPVCSPFNTSINSATSLPVVRCSGKYNIQRGQVECFTREGITVNLTKSSTSDESQSMQSYLDSLTTNIDLLQKTCSDLSRYQRAAACGLQVSLRCGTAQYKDYFPTDENFRSMLKSLCDNTNVIDGECLKTVDTRLHDCRAEKERSYAENSSRTEVLCSTIAKNTECLSEVMPTCGCPMTRLYVETSKRYSNGPACSPITVKTPACQPGTNEFIDSTATMLPPTSQPARNEFSNSAATMLPPTPQPARNEFTDSAATMLHRMPLLLLTALVIFGLCNTM